MREYIDRLKEALDTINQEKVDKLVKLVNLVWTNNKTVYICGNGGSALTAQHWATDWIKGTYTEAAKPIYVHCLNDNIGLVTAWSNDDSYEHVFSNQLLSSRCGPGDLLIGISGSGNSVNVISAMETAGTRKMRRFGISGFMGGVLRVAADDYLHIPVNDMQIFEDISLAIGHYVFRELSGKG